MPDTASPPRYLSAAWEAATAAAHTQPAAPSGCLAELDVEPAEVLGLVNRLRRVQGLAPVPRLRFGGAVPEDEHRCLFALALRCRANPDVLRFRRRRAAAAVARELGVAQDDDYEVATPWLIAFVMQMFDDAVLSEGDLEMQGDRPDQLSLPIAPAGSSSIQPGTVEPVDRALIAA